MQLRAGGLLVERWSVLPESDGRLASDTNARPCFAVLELLKAVFERL